MEASDINTLKSLFNSMREGNENMTTLNIKMKLSGDGEIDVAYNLSAQGQKKKRVKTENTDLKKKSCLKGKAPEAPANKQRQKTKRLSDDD